MALAYIYFLFLAKVLITKAYRNRSFDKQNNVLLVAHSQGNIVGNKVYTQLTSTEKSKFRMVSVGTPADHVAGVKYTDKPQHVTGYLDLIINNPLVANSLPANTDVVGHNFISSYLGGEKGGNAIAKLVKTAYMHLDGYTGCSEYDTVYLYVNGLEDTILVKGKILGTYATEVISKQEFKSKEIDDECRGYSNIWDYKSKLYHFYNDFYSWRIAPFKTQEQVLSHKSAKLSYKNYYAKCVDISFEDTVYDAVYKALAK